MKVPISERVVKKRPLRFAKGDMGGITATYKLQRVIHGDLYIDHLGSVDWICLIV